MGGGEFINNEVSDLCEKLNIELKSTAAESAWSNGLVERHNGTLANMIDKILSDVDCDLEVALSCAIAAKNALNNVYGFSPNILVFGRNPNLPNIFINKPPANNPVTISKYLCDFMNAMQSARESFIQQESSEKLKRAILRKTRGYSDQTFQIGDMVYYRRDNNIYWHGPAKIVGRDNKTFLLKVNGLFVRVHACRLQHVSSLDNRYKESSATVENIRSTIPTVPTPLIDSSDSSEDDTTSTSQAESPATLSSRFNEISTSNQEEESVVNVQGNKDLPAFGSIISFKLPSDDEWRSGTVINRGRKASTASWHFLNIKEGDTDKCVSFKNSIWKPLQCNDTPDDLYITENDDENAAFAIAKAEELQKWAQMKVFEAVPNTGQSTISCRWVLTKKVKQGNITYKARLVARGFEEDTLTLKTDSPTCCKDTLRLVFSLLSAKRWPLHSIDIKSAFLQGLPLQREVYLKPPKHAKTKDIWKILKPIYGLADAGRHWYLRVVEVVVDLGATQSKIDKSLFIWKFNGKTAGVIAVHVDDFIYGGTQMFLDKVIKRIFEIFYVGSQEHMCFKYIGMQVNQTNNYIKLSMSEYAASLGTFDLSCFPSVKSNKLTVDEKKLLKRFSGQINWLVTQCRPDLAYDNCIIGNSLQSPAVKDIVYANKIVRKLNCADASLFFHAGLDFSKCSIVSFCDASFGNLPNGGSQGAFITFLVDRNGTYSPISWQSRRIKRVVKSTLAAECLAAIESAESCVLLCTIFKELLSCQANSSSIDVIVFCDNRNLVDSVHSTTSIEDRRLLIDVCVLRDMVSNGEINNFSWIPTDLQIANCLTKQGASTNNLLKVLNNKLILDIQTGEFHSE